MTGFWGVKLSGARPPSEGGRRPATRRLMAIAWQPTGDVLGCHGLLGGPRYYSTSGPKSRAMRRTRPASASVAPTSQPTYDASGGPARGALLLRKWRVAGPIWIDDDAAGHDWFEDLTPRDNSVFANDLTFIQGP